jgi:hypothetical protein
MVGTNQGIRKHQFLQPFVWFVRLRTKAERFTEWKIWLLTNLYAQRLIAISLREWPKNVGYPGLPTFYFQILFKQAG